jgi:putative acyl-CoA dehydrogenase
MDERLDFLIRSARRNVESLASSSSTAQYEARRVVERLALVFQGSLVVRHSPPAVAEAFLASRLAGDWGSAFGTLPSGIDCETIIERHRPGLPAPA